MALNQQENREMSHHFSCQFSNFLPKATILSLFLRFLPQFSTREKTAVIIDTTALHGC
ncbi:hypothetical protein RV18_GL002151 [Enterococcus termitis]|nr:hypothetical protein RV18_GL002151 [Enterococcus termitis]